MLPQTRQKIIFMHVTMASSLLENVCSGRILSVTIQEGEVVGRESVFCQNQLIWLGKIDVLLGTEKLLGLLIAPLPPQLCKLVQ